MPLTLEVLVICAELNMQEQIAAAIEEGGHRVVCCSTVGSARNRVAQQDFGAVFCQDFLPDGEFQDVLEFIRRAGLRVPFVVLSRRDDWGAYVAALGAGAFDYIACPPDRAETKRILGMALERPSVAA